MSHEGARGGAGALLCGPGSRPAAWRCGVVLVVEFLEVAFYVGVHGSLALLDREARRVLVRLERVVQVPRLAHRDALHVGEDLRRGPDLDVRDHPLAAEVADTGGWQEPGEFPFNFNGDAMFQCRKYLLDRPLDLVVTDGERARFLCRMTRTNTS